jgi:hypothetical protein
MRVLLTALVVLGLFAVWMLWRAATTMCQEEIRTRIGQLPRALIWLAARRLPKELRSDLAAEWTAELEFMVAETEGLPITRFWRGLTYAGGLILAAPCVGREMVSAQELQVPMSMRLIALGAVIYAAEGELKYAIQYLGGVDPVRGISPSLMVLAAVGLALDIILKGPLRWRSIALFMLSMTACGIGMLLFGGWCVFVGVALLILMMGLFLLRLMANPVVGNESEHPLKR